LAPEPTVVVVDCIESARGLLEILLLECAAKLILGAIYIEYLLWINSIPVVCEDQR